MNRLHRIYGVALLVLLATGCSDDSAATTITLAPATADPVTARDKDVAWIYHLAKARQTDDLVGRLDRERQTLAAVATPGAPKNILATEPPESAKPIAVVPSGIAPSAAGSATPRPENPLAGVPMPQLDPAIVYGLYAIDPATYRTLFVQNYPTTVDGVQHDYGERLARAGLPGGIAAPVVALAHEAGAGDDVALAKLYEASSAASGGVEIVYAQTIAQLVKGHPDLLLPMLVRMPMSTRLSIASQSDGWCRFPPRNVLADVPDDPDELAVQRDLRATLTDCARRRVVHRHSHSRSHRRPRTIKHRPGNP